MREERKLPSRKVNLVPPYTPETWERRKRRMARAVALAHSLDNPTVQRELAARQRDWRLGRRQP